MASLSTKLQRSLLILSRLPSPIPIISVEEERFIIINASEQGKILVVAHTDDGELVRLISARDATYGERKSYEES